ncbi:MAG TPA: MFS transporter, partial [Candidatus Limnocylindrales bacterium]|nr:MFS transporter [Candidatus Limnocylindrales bacterium]
MSDLTTRSLVGAWLLDRTGDWLALITILVAAAELSVDNASAIGWALGLWVAPRMVIGILYASVGDKLGERAWPALALAKAVLIVLVFGVAVATPLEPESAEWLLGTAAVLGFAAALTTESRALVLRGSFGIERVGQLSAAASFVDRLAVLLAGALAAVVGYVAPVGIALGLAIVAFAAAAVLAYSALQRARGQSRANLVPTPVEEPDPRETARQTVLWLITAFTSGAVGAAFLVTAFTFFIDVSVGGDGFRPESGGALLVAATGLGMALGPLPMPRLLLRLPAALILVGLALSVAVAAVVLAVAPSLPVALAAFAAFGFTAVSIDRLRSIALKRVVPPTLSPRLVRMSILAVSAGQLFGALGIVSTPGREPIEIVVFLAVAQLVLVGLGAVRGGRGALRVGSLSPLAIKSVVHKLSWDTDPPAQALNSEDLEPRVRKLARWINRTVDLQRLTAVLPISKREYTVFRPDDVSRESLFEAGRA